MAPKDSRLAPSGPPPSPALQELMRIIARAAMRRQLPAQPPQPQNRPT